MLNEKVSLRVYLQYYEWEINLSRIMQKAYQESSDRIVEPVEALRVYVKPEDGKAYYVANNKYECYVNLWDSRQDISWNQEISGEVNFYSDINRHLIFEYRGHQCDCRMIIDRCVEKFLSIYSANELDEVEIYVRMEDQAAYYVINGRHTGSVSIQ